MIERYEVEALLVLAEELHFGRTAERLHVSTTRVSQTIRKVERRVGVPLFRRTSRHVELTPAGRNLVEDLRPAWQAVGAALERAVEAGRGLSGSLRVAFVGAAAGQLVAGAAQAFRDRTPDCEVRLREAQTAELIPWLREGEADLGLGAVRQEPGIACGPVLVTEPWMLAVPADHPLAHRAGVPVAELARVPVLRLDGHDAAVPVPPQGAAPGPRAATFQEALTLVGAGQGVLPVGAHTRRYYVRPDVAYVPLDGAPPLEWALLWPADGATARVRAFAEAAAALVHGPG
ncbi:LysR family transcriptional regulator [Kitasatospora sp. NPDC054939]